MIKPPWLRPLREWTNFTTRTTINLGQIVTSFDPETLIKAVSFETALIFSRGITAAIRIPNRRAGRISATSILAMTLMGYAVILLLSLFI
jgi:hypothetical protein